MCGLVIARNLTRFDELMQDNLYRGGLYHSISYIGNYNGLIDVVRMQGPYRVGSVSPPTPYQLYIGHQQAPTGVARTDKNVHPSVYQNCYLQKSYLWHNGMVKEVQLISHRWFGWDTDYIHQGLVEVGVGALDHIDGSFACIWWYQNKLRIFRNDIVPLFYHPDGSLSSTYFDGAALIKAGVMYTYHLESGMLIPGETFINTENPYLL